MTFIIELLLNLIIEIVSAAFFGSGLTLERMKLWNMFVRALMVYGPNV